MGHEIVYCALCARMLRTVDFEKGEAFRFEERSFCAECAPPEARRGSPAPVPKAPSPRAQDSSRHKAVRAPEPAPSRPPWKLLAGGGLGLGAAAVLAILMVGTSRSGPPDAGRLPPEPATPRAPSSHAPKEDPREKAALAALERARAALRSNPEDLEPVVAAFEGAVAAAQETGFATPAERELAAVMKLRRERLSAAIRAAESEFLAALNREEFKVAADFLEAARQATKDIAVREALRERGEELRKELARLRESLRAQAVEARRRGSEKEVTDALDRAGRWGDPVFVKELGQILASVPGPPSPEAGVYRQRWLAALEMASGRDYGGATRLLEEAARELREPRLREEADGDRTLLRGVLELVKGASQAFDRLEKGQKLSLEVLDLEGRPRRAQGVVVRSGPGWVGVREEKDVVIVDREDLTAAAVLELGGNRAGPGETALFLILEQSAREEGQAALPEKYGVYSRGRPPATEPPGEREARRLFRGAYDPEREWPERRRKGNSEAVYRKLLTEFGETAFVRRHRDRIAARAEPPGEVVFQAGDLKGSGTFRLDLTEKAACHWLVSSVPPTGSGRDTYVELEFEVGAESAWLAWAYVGACCAESLSLYWQETDLVDPLAKGQKATLEPGSHQAMVVKASIAKLPKAHSPSRPDPSQFAWIALPMPKSSPTGPKKARLLADRPGLAIKAVIVSSIRSAAPSEAEARDLDQLTLPTAVRGLVGWWKLDESEGPSVDATGNRHTGAWVGSPSRSSPGAPALASSSGCLSLGGRAQHVDLENPSGFPAGRSPRSLCGWGRSASTAGGYRWIASFGAPSRSQAMFIGQNGTTLVGGGFGDDLTVGGLWDGQWHHVALTYDGTTARLFWDGLEKASMGKSWDLVPKAATIGRQVGFDSEYWNGQVGDVRIYNRALADGEIRLLAQGR